MAASRKVGTESRGGSGAAGRSSLEGQRFGRLTAMEPTEGRSGGYTVWRCRCDCGNEVLLPSRSLKRGGARDCGCMPKMRGGHDLSGRRFGRLTVLNRSEGRRPDGKVCWDCICDCGGKVATTASQLLAGYRKSCGCLSRPQRKDWVGRRFGRLEVTSYAGKREGRHFWQCLCDCGKECQVCQSNLKSGHTISCGCMSDPTETRHFVEGTCIESIRSRKVSANNTSGIRGVYQNRRSGRWAAQITFQGRTRYLGSFDRLEEAARARAVAEELFEEFLEKYDNGLLAQEDVEDRISEAAAGRVSL